MLVYLVVQVTNQQGFAKSTEPPGAALFQLALPESKPGALPSSL